MADLEIRVPTLANKLPHVAKKTSRLMGFLKLLSRRKVVTMKAVPRREKAEVTFSTISRVCPWDGEIGMMRTRREQVPNAYEHSAWRNQKQN